MENRINSGIILAVNKKSKLLGYLRKLNYGDIEKISVRIIGTPKGKPINLFFTKNLITNKFTGIGAVDSFLVYARYSKPEGGKVVLLGSATINSLQKLGFTSVDNKESDECVAINIYAKGQDALDLKELQDILSRIKKLSTYGFGLVNTSETTLVELKPENKRIISYEVSIVPAVKTGKAQEHSVNPSVSQDNPSLKEDTNSSAVKEKITTMASFAFSRDAYKYAKKLNKILSVGEIDIKADSLTKVGKISSFKSGIDIKGNNYTVVAISELDEQIAMDCYNRHKYKSSQFTVGALFEYQDYIKNIIIGAISRRHFEIKQNKIARRNLSRAVKTTTEGIPPIRKRYMVTEEKSPISHLESLLEKNQKTSNQKRDKDLISIIAEALREIESISKANVGKSSKAAATEDLFCKKTKVNSKRDSNQTRPYQVQNPLVTILTNDESKNKVKEIIEEANKAKSFPYKLDYNNNCVVKISDNLFDILECRNKLEDILKIRKDIDIGIFKLEHTGNLALKKIFNISSLTVYHSASKNIYALIGA